MPKEVTRTYATTAGKPGRVYFLLDKQVGGRSAVGNADTRDLPVGKRYIVSISVTLPKGEKDSERQGTRRILAFEEVNSFAGVTERKKAANGTVFIPPVDVESLFPIPQKDEEFFIDEEIFTTISSVFKAYKGKNANVFLIGPQGVGKTSLAQQVAASFGFNYFEFQVPQVREPMDWIGHLTPDDQQIIFKENLFVSAVSVPRTIICLNEFNRVDTSLHNAIYDLLSDRRETYFDEMGKVVKVARDVHFFITMNLSHDNVGTFPLDSAMWDRATSVIEMAWMDPLVEQNVLVKKTGVDPIVAEKLIKVTKDLRDKWKEGKIPSAPSFRWLQSAAMLIMAGLSFKYAFNTTYLTKYSNDGYPNSYRAIVRAAAKAKLGDEVK